MKNSTEKVWSSASGAEGQVQLVHVRAKERILAVTAVVPARLIVIIAMD